MYRGLVCFVALAPQVPFIAQPRPFSLSFSLSLGVLLLLLLPLALLLFLPPFFRSGFKMIISNDLEDAAEKAVAVAEIYSQASKVRAPHFVG